jgi:hypothetical protein
VADFEGMRWIKFDFQVQTPEDGAHWTDGETKLPEPRRSPVQSHLAVGQNFGAKKFDESRIQDIARIYLRRCHELRLEAIGVTDHNFSQRTEPREWFLTHLVEQNRVVADELGRPPVHIFPGFEVDIGFHALCLFQPAKKLSNIWRVNKILCKLGLDENERFRHGRPLPLRRLSANVSLKELLEIVQDQYGGIVIAAHADQNDGVLSDSRHIEDYRNQNLLALEVTSNPPSRRVLDIVDGRDRSWARPDCHPAYVMSSDAKSLKARDDGTIPPNALGYRYSWVKMSKPSIEALRQAFLDPISRIALLGNLPSEALQHPRITRLVVKGAAFLNDQDLQFSEMLNCVIGGRGSGKSSMLEYLRFAIGMDEQDARSRDEDLTISRKRRQLLASLGSSAEIRVTFQVAAGVTDTLVFQPGLPEKERRHLEGREVSDLDTVLRQLQVQFFSQSELSRMTSGEEGQVQVLSLVDNACGSQLAQLKTEERDLRGKLTHLFQSSREARRFENELNVTTQEAAELDRQISARGAVRPESLRHQFALEAQLHLQDLVSSEHEITATLESLIGSLPKALPLIPATSDQWPALEWFVAARREIQKARQDLATSLDLARDQYFTTMERLIGPDSSKPVRDAVDIAQTAFREACIERGIQTGDVAKMQDLEEKHLDRLRKIRSLRVRLEAVAVEALNLTGALTTLHELWRAQFEIRRNTAQLIQQQVASQTVRIRIEEVGKALGRAWS